MSISLVGLGIRHRIVPARVERMTSEDSPDCQPPASKSPVPLNGLYGVLRAGGVEAASARQKRRDDPLVEPYRQDKQSSKHA